MVLAAAPTDQLTYWLTVVEDIAISFASIAALIGAVSVAVNIAFNRRDQLRFTRERWRTSYGNLNITMDSQLTHPAGIPRAASGVSSGARTQPLSMTGLGAAADDASQFQIFRLTIDNIGDGPVDIWACLIAARELNTVDHREAWGGNIEWNDLQPYYFGTKLELGKKLDGISNTRHAVYSQDDYLQLDPKERDTLTRIDRIDAVLSHTTLLYRAFLVGVGYGGELRNTDNRDMLDWQRLQQSLFNVSGPSFRILFDEPDPLDRVADRDGWQCFMLYHRAFTDDVRDKVGWTKIDRLNGELEGEWGQQHTEQQALELCKSKLADEQARWAPHWQAFKQAVEECKRLENGFIDLLKSGWRPQVVSLPKGTRDDLTQMTAADAFKRLPKYLRWDPKDEDSMPVWEKFFLVTLEPTTATGSSPARLALPPTDSDANTPAGSPASVFGREEEPAPNIAAEFLGPGGPLGTSA